MSVTAKKAKEVLDEIEGGLRQTGVSGWEVASILLGKENYASSKDRIERGLYDTSLMEQHRETMNAASGISYYRPLTASRSILKKPIIFVKRVLRKMMRYLIQPMADDQTEFNRASAATVNEMYHCQMEVMQEMQNGISKRAELQDEIDSLNLLIEDLRSLEEKAHILLKKHEEPADGEYAAIDYEDFENHFRGPREDIKEFLSIYIKYFKEADHVLDLGCGRGEFLELCEENGIPATGVDLYDKFVDYCTGKGFDVIEGDALDHLESCPDSSVGGLFMSQVVEHLTLDALVRLCHLAMTKLKPGAYVIMETPNPMSMAIYRNCFYIDPSHNKPVHPYTLEYLLRKAGFRDTNLIFTESSRTHEQFPHLVSEGIENLEEFNKGMDRLTDLMFGSQDYAVIARKGVVESSV